jgi:DNA polymerase-4
VREVNWVFLDMNSYFASAEQHLRPELRGHPVGVIPMVTESTCVIAASVEAKRFGVRTGTIVPEAKRLCPEIKLVKARPEVYVRLHHEIARSIDRHLPIHKAYSVDEWAMRLMGEECVVERALEIGRRIRAQMLGDFSEALPCSIGIAPTRLLAKIACELEKPNGLTALTVGDLPRRLSHLELTDLTGINKGVVSRLNQRGVRTVEQLWALSRREAVAAWGSVVGGDWWAGFHGVDEPERATRKRSMGHENVLEPRLRTEDGARQMLARLVYRLGTRLRREGMLAGRLSFFLKCKDGHGFQRDTPLGLVNDTPSLLHAFRGAWRERGAIWAPPWIVGAHVSKLVHESQATGCLFGEPEVGNRLSEALDAINTRWGPTAAFFGALHDCSHEMDEKIAFGRVPELIERGVRTKPKPQHGEHGRR